MKLGFTGTSDVVTSEQFDLLLAVIGELSEMTEAHHGDCICADNIFSLAIDELWPDVEVNIHPPLISDKRAFCRADVMHEKKDYITRNHDIVDSTDILIACPKGTERKRGSGTWATIRYARKLKRPIAILWPDGKYTYENQSDTEFGKAEGDETSSAEV